MRKLALLTVLVAILAFSYSDTSSAQFRKRLRLRPLAEPQAALPALPVLPAAKVFTSPTTGKQHVITPTGEFFESKEPAPNAIATPVSDEFMPSSAPQRKIAKLSVAPGKLEIFANIDDLRKSLPSEAAMQKHNPPITRATDFDRVAEEKRNVSVTAFIYAMSREGDNDFHVIIGGDPDDAARLYMNVEVSGLPPAGDPFRDPLKKARDQFKNHLGVSLPGRGFQEVNPPIKVQVTGSLFYDISHPPDAPGPKAHKPHTSWEIHPVTDIQFPK